MCVDRLLERSAQRFPDKTAVVCGETRVSYRDVEERSNRLAHALIGAGVRRGDRVAICLEETDLCLYAQDHGTPPEATAEAVGLTCEQLSCAYQAIKSKREAARYLHMPPLVVAALEGQE